MAMRAPLAPALDKDLKDIIQFITIVQDETKRALSYYEPYLVLLTQEQHDDVNFHDFFYSVKTMTRTLFGAIVGLSSLMRQAVVRNASSEELGLSNQVLAKLSERKYDRNTDTISSDPSRYLTTLESFKLALKHFPSLFSAEFDIELGREPGWQSLVKLKKARDSFTHPQRLADLVPFDALTHLNPAFLWVQATLKNLFDLVGSAYGRPPSEPVETSSIRPQSFDFPADPNDIFDSNFYDKAKRQMGFMAVATEMMKWMNDDTKRALDILREQQKKIKPEALGDRPLASHNGLQFAARNLLRTFFAEVEGTISYGKYVLESGEAHDHVTLDPRDKSLLETEEIDEQLWAVARLWSRELGFNRSIDKNSHEWKIFQSSRRWRNQVTHPTSVLEYFILPSWLKHLYGLPAWLFSEVLSVMEIDLAQLE